MLESCADHQPQTQNRRRAPSKLLAIALVLLPGSFAWSKPPALEKLFPPGGPQGKSVAVSLTGSFDHWPIQSWSEPAGLTIKPENDKGKLTIDIAPDAALGVHWIRLYDDEGATALKPFIVGNLPEVVASMPKEGPQVLDTARVTVNGQLTKRGAVDEFALTLKKGETLVASVEANRQLKSPMDAVLQIARPDGIVLAQNDDEHGFDPQLAFAVPADGTYHVRLFAFPATPDSTIGFAGGNAFLYRLTLTTGGFLDHSYPLAVSRAEPGQVEVFGWNVPSEATRLTVPTDANAETAFVAHPQLANAFEVRLETHAALVEHEPNDYAHPQSLAVPATVTGRINPARDVDVYEFSAKKGQAVIFRIESRSLGAPLDPVLRITDRAGKNLAEVDDAGKEADGELTFSASEDGTYRLTVRDLNSQGGDRYVYRLTASIPEPDYRLSLAADRFTLTPGKPLEIPVTVERKRGYDRPIDVRIEGLPDGVEAAPLRSEPKGDSSRKVTLSLTSKPGGPPVSSPFRVRGASNEEPPRTRLAQIPIAGFDVSTTQAWLTVVRSEEKK